MKAKLILTALFTFYFLLFTCEAQVPQGFNYQAIARDGLGNAITGATMQVKIGILSDTILNTMVWEELFNPVRTNAFGMFNIVVGTGVKQSGSAPLFSAIDWTKTPLFLRTSIMYPSPGSWKTMGTTKLQSVPYSMVAANLEGTVPLLSVKGNTTTMDSALFVVRNNTGQIVFAVYNEGVRIYVDDGLAKGSRKGGFAIGSFDKSKGTSQPLFVVDPDSIRAYLDNNPVKAVKGGFAIGGFDKSKLIGNQQLFMVSVDSVRVYIDDNLSKGSKKGGFAIGSFDKSKGGNANYFNISPDSTGKVFPSQNRILWYPLKNALLAGKVIAQNKDSVGVNSFASGYESKSKGKYSQALGYKAVAKGDYSTAIGKDAIADTSSFSFGNQAKALRNSSYAFGSGAYALGNMSFAFGSVGIDSLGNVTGNTKATGDHAYSFGMGSLASGRGAFALGANDTAAGNFSYSAGYKTKSSQWYSTALGGYSQAIGLYSSAVGYKTVSSATAAIAIGYAAQAIGQYSTSIGYFTKTAGAFAVSLGANNNSQGAYSATIGYDNNITTGGAYSFAAGGDNTVSGSYSFVTGNYSQATAAYSMTGGYGSIASKTASTAIGYQTQANGTYSIALGFGSIASGSGSTAMNYTTTASGDYSVALNQQSSSTGKNAISAGYLTTAQAYASLVIGRYNVIAGTTSSWVTTEPLLVAGNGTSAAARNNALTLTKDGNMTIAGTLTQLSDIRLKDKITTFTEGISAISKINPVYFEFRDQISHPSGRQIGFIAQEIQKTVPELVQKGADGYLSVDYSKMTVVLMQAFKEQQAIIEKQNTENAELNKKMKDLEMRTDKLERLLSGKK